VNGMVDCLVDVANLVQPTDHSIYGFLALPCAGSEDGAIPEY